MSDSNKEKNDNTQSNNEKPSDKKTISSDEFIVSCVNCGEEEVITEKLGDGNPERLVDDWALQKTRTGADLKPNAPEDSCKVEDYAPKVYGWCPECRSDFPGVEAFTDRKTVPCGYSKAFKLDHAETHKLGSDPFQECLKTGNLPYRLDEIDEIIDIRREDRYITTGDSVDRPEQGANVNPESDREPQYCNQCNKYTTEWENAEEKKVCIICRSETYDEYKLYVDEMKSWIPAHSNIKKVDVEEFLLKHGNPSKGQSEAILSNEYVLDTTPHDANDMEGAIIGSNRRPELISMIAKEVGVSKSNENALSTLTLYRVSIRLGMDAVEDKKSDARMALRSYLDFGEDDKFLRRRELQDILLILRNQSLTSSNTEQSKTQ